MKFPSLKQALIGLGLLASISLGLAGLPSCSLLFQGVKPEGPDPSQVEGVLTLYRPEDAACEIKVNGNLVSWDTMSLHSFSSLEATDYEIECVSFEPGLVFEAFSVELALHSLKARVARNPMRVHIDKTELYVKPLFRDAEVEASARLSAYDDGRELPPGILLP